jgi:hypothetical protein
MGQDRTVQRRYRTQSTNVESSNVTHYRDRIVEGNEKIIIIWNNHSV